MTDLILIPTPKERSILEPAMRRLAASPHWAVQLCGFGPITAAARTAALISRYQPDRVLLIGIAGTFAPDRHSVGSACRFDQVASHGIGVGAGEEFRSADELGWKQFSGGDASPTIGDQIQLTSTFVGDKVPCHGQLLTSCAASANASEAESKKSQFPGAVAEDMEGYGVAVACTLAGVPLQIVRGISNVVGDRDPASWQIEAALESAAELAMRLVPWQWIPTDN